MFGVERNEPCWCGSGRKYKTCHLRKDEDILYPMQREGYILPNKNIILQKEQIEGMRISAKITKKILDDAEIHIKEGVSTLEVNDIIHKLTINAGAIPAPLNYNGFPKSCCTSINNVVCHGIPSKDDILKDGDIVNVDITSIFNGYHADMSRMYMIGNVSENARKLVEVTKECLFAGIDAVKPYEPVSNIGSVINDIADKHNYSIIRALSGHGIGLKFHQEPTINHYRTNDKTMIMIPNMVFTIEPMINEGTYDCYVDEIDKWTVYTKDKKLSAQWEHTILVTEDGFEILTL